MFLAMKHQGHSEYMYCSPVFVARIFIAVMLLSDLLPCAQVNYQSQLVLFQRAITENKVFMYDSSICKLWLARFSIELYSCYGNYCSNWKTWCPTKSLEMLYLALFCDKVKYVYINCTFFVFLGFST